MSTYQNPASIFGSRYGFRAPYKLSLVTTVSPCRTQSHRSIVSQLLSFLAVDARLSRWFFVASAASRSMLNMPPEGERAPCITFIPLTIKLGASESEKTSASSLSDADLLRPASRAPN